eukprot:jgi/Botrbrau1/21825/Bobra.0190s0040.1
MATAIDAATVPANDSPAGETSFHWTAGKVVLSVFLFVAAGACEIGGGWLVWKAVRESRPWWWAIFGSLVLVGYGFIPTAQPTSSFGRVYAVYGGFFIILSYLWAWALDGDKPDTGDWIGSGVALGGVLLAYFWPRK